MKISRHYFVELDEFDQFDFTKRPGTTIHVTKINITRGADGQIQTIWFIGPRRLLRGGLSIQDPISEMADRFDIPGRIWRKLCTQKVVQR